MPFESRTTRRGSIFSPYMPNAITLADIRLDSILRRRADELPPDAEREEDVPIKLHEPRCRYTASGWKPPPHQPPVQSPSRQPPPYIFDPSVPVKERKRLKKAARQRQRRQAAAANDACSPRRQIKGVTLKHIINAIPAHTAYVAPHREYVGPRTSTDHTPYTMEDLHLRGFQHLPWPGKEPLPILDATGACIMVLGGHPSDPCWDALQRETYNDIEEAASRCRFSAEQLMHRRGSYPTLGIGISFGGGQICPGNLKNTKHNAAIMHALISKPFFRRMAGFSDNTFRSFFPGTHENYAAVLDTLCADSPHLRRNFIECVWAAAHINFGPSAYTDRHTDFLNLVRGMCVVWALGNFNAKKGGHLVVWDLKLIIEFPPGSCILLPSALLEHSNLPIQEGEHRCSFVMYSAAGLFRWVENGMMSDLEFLQGGRERVRIWKERRAALPLKNIRSFPIWKDLLQRCTEELQCQHRV